MNIETHTLTQDDGVQFITMEGLDLANYSRADGFANFHYRDDSVCKAMCLYPESITVAIGKGDNMEISITNSQGRTINFSNVPNVIIKMSDFENSKKHFNNIIGGCMVNNTNPIKYNYKDAEGQIFSVDRVTTIAVKEDLTRIHLSIGDEQEVDYLSYISFSSPKLVFDSVRD